MKKHSTTRNAQHGEGSTQIPRRNVAISSMIATMTEPTGFKEASHGFCPICDSAPSSSFEIAIREHLKMFSGRRVKTLVDMLLVGLGISSHSILRIPAGSEGTVDGISPGKLCTYDDLRIGSHGGSYACEEGSLFIVYVVFDSIEECCLNDQSKSRDEQVQTFDESTAEWKRHSTSACISPACLTLI